MQHVAAIDAVLQSKLAPFNQMVRAKNLPKVVDRNAALRRIIPQGGGNPPGKWTATPRPI